MTAGNGNGSDPHRLEAEIAQTRRDLGDTIAALAHKADVKRQVGERKDHVMARARELAPGSPDGAGGGGAAPVVQQAAERARREPLLLAVAAAIVIGIVVGRMTRRRR